MKRILAFLLTLALAMSLFAACSAEDDTPVTTEAPSTGPSYDVITIEEALELCGEPGNITEERYYIRGTIDSIDNANYGAMTISDDTGSIYVYGTYSEDGSIGYAEMTEKPFKGDEVLLHCILQNYNGTKEVKNARLIEFKKVQVQVNTGDYTEMSIKDARTATEGTKVQVHGVVARITYANGMIPNGVMLVDETSSIYVYDSDLAARVQIGSKITICANKTWWILGDETTHAATFGYKGCCQLDSAVLIESASDLAEFDKSWITESTVKEMLDTPLTTDITSLIFKVTALIKKVPGKGFTNYYFNDLDGTTGTYTYTHCSGSDFAWLDEFDGKICTVYLTILNAKSTNSGCVYRFLPIAVIDEGFDVSTVNAAEHAVNYYGVGQFQASYTGNPALELITSVSSDLLKFQDAKLTYSSSDSSIIAINTAGGKAVMNCLKSGTAKITVTGTYGDKTYSQDMTINVTIADDSNNYATVSDAINAATGTKVTAKGIVGPSLVNQTGFYLIDETGVIAVRTSASVLSTLEIGHEVVLEGVRHINTKGGAGYHGQSCLDDATVVTNNYGSHDYSTASFAGNISVADFYNLDAGKDLTTTVYTMRATVVIQESQHYTNIYLSDGSTKVRLYCNNAGQYSFLKAYAGQEVTVEIAPCNWNDKSYYVGCVLSVVNSDGTKTVNSLNFK